MAPPVKLRSIPLFLPNWGESQLKDRHDQQPRSFERGFRLRAFSDEEMSFPAYAKCRIPGVSLGEHQRNHAWPAFTGVDLSSKKRPGNAIVTARLDPISHRRFPIDVRYGRWKSNETAEQISIVNQLYNPVVVMVEDNAYQAALIEWAETDKARYPWWVKVEPTTTTSETKPDPDRGLPVLQTEFSHGAWVFPLSEIEGARPDEPTPRGFWARLDAEIRNHPLAVTSDGVMALWFCRQGMELFAPRLGSGGDVGDVSSR